MNKSLAEGFTDDVHLSRTSTPLHFQPTIMPPQKITTNENNGHVRLTTLADGDYFDDKYVSPSPSTQKNEFKLALPTGRTAVNNNDVVSDTIPPSHRPFRTLVVCLFWRSVSHIFHRI